MAAGAPSKAILVAGMHRSGTSAVARVIGLLGAKLSQHLLLPDRNNITGFWESVELNEAHEALLASAGSAWDDVLAFPARWYELDSAREFRSRLLEILRTDYKDAPMWVAKDPRMCRIVPLWLSVLREYGADPVFVIPVRNPFEVAASLKARDGFSLEKSLLLWLRHVADAEVETRRYPRSIVLYDDLLSDWRRCMTKVGRDIQVEWPVTPDAAAAKIESFLSTRHRHHVADTNMLGHSDEVPEWVREVMSALRGDPSLMSGKIDAVRTQLDTAEHMYGPLLTDIRSQHKAVQEKNRQLLADQGSLTTAGAPEISRLRAVVLELQHQVAANATDLANLQANEAELQYQVVHRDAELSRHAASAAEQRRSIEHLTAALSRHAASTAEQQRRIEHLTATVARRQQHLNEILTSTSWRITAPMRALVSAARTLRLPQVRRKPVRGIRIAIHNLWIMLGWVVYCLRWLGRRCQVVIMQRVRLERDIWILHRARFVDGDWYRDRYGNIAQENVAPTRHYARRGAAEGRNPNKWFDTQEYLRQNPDVRMSGMNPAVHYVRYGRAEGRQPSSSQTVLSVEECGSKPQVATHTRTELSVQRSQRIIRPTSATTFPDLFYMRTWQTSKKMAVVVHVDTVDKLEVLLNTLGGFPATADLFFMITLPVLERAEEKIIESGSPGFFLVFPDDTAQMACFLHLTKSGVLFKYDAIAKLNAAQFTTDPKSRASGGLRNWKTVTLLESSKRVLRRFQDQPDVGIVVPAAGMTATTQDPDVIRQLKIFRARLGRVKVITPMNSATGPIIWIRPFLLRHINALGLGQSDFLTAGSKQNRVLETAAELFLSEITAESGLLVCSEESLEKSQTRIAR